MRLIDADELIAIMDEDLKKNTHHTEEDKLVHIQEHIHLIDKIKKQPTAYDMNKIIERLEAHKKDVDDAIPDVVFYRDGIKKGLDWAIEEVKKGGIE